MALIEIKITITVTWPTKYILGPHLWIILALGRLIDWLIDLFD